MHVSCLGRVSDRRVSVTSIYHAIHRSLSIFIARYLKERLKKWWYRLHMFVMVGLTGGLSLIGMLFMSLYTYPPHFESNHAVRSSL